MEIKEAIKIIKRLIRIAELGYVDGGFHLETEPEKAQEACERILGMIEERHAHLFKYLTSSQNRAEMEKFWKESIPIMGRE